MSSRIIAEFHVEPEKLSEFKEVMKEALVDTRSFNGFIKLEIVEDVENCILYALSEWESHSHYDDYVAWRLENGLGDLLDQYLVEGLQGFKPHKVIETNMRSRPFLDSGFIVGYLFFLREISWTHRETIMAVSNLDEFLVLY